MRLLLILAALTAWAQINTSNLANHAYRGTGVPTSSCVVGVSYFQTDAATAGRNLWLCTATNVWTLLRGDVDLYGGAYYYISSGGTPTPIVIDVVNQYHGFSLVTTGANENGWTHKVGTGPYTISGITNNNAVVPNTILVTTSAPHNLDVGDYVKHTGFAVRTVYNGSWKVLTVPLSTTYTVARAYDTSTDTGFVKRSFSLRANTGSAGVYLVQFTTSIQATANTTSLRAEVVKNTTDQDNVASQVFFTTQDRPGTLAGAGIVTIADDDVLWMQVKNLTDDSDLAVWLLNFVVIRL